MAARFKNLIAPTALWCAEVANRIFAIEDREAALEAFLLQNMAVAAYGSMSLAAPPFFFGTIDVNWRNINAYDTIDFTPKGVVVTPGTGFFRVTQDTIYRLSFSAAIAHNELNASRELFIRAFNVTDAVVVGEVFPFGTVRNQAVTNLNISALFEVNESNKNKDFVFQISAGASTYSACDFENCSFDVNAVGEWRDVI